MLVGERLGFALRKGTVTVAAWEMESTVGILVSEMRGEVLGYVLSVMIQGGAK